MIFLNKLLELLNTDTTANGSNAGEMILLENITQEMIPNSRLRMININYYSIYFKAQRFHLKKML